MRKHQIFALTDAQRRMLFAKAFLAFLDRNNTTAADVARQVGIQYQRVFKWTKGRSMPSIHVVHLINDAYGDDELMKKAIVCNTRKCASCRKEFISDKPQGRKFLCGFDCQRESNRLLRKMGKSAIGLTEFTNRNLYAEAVDRFCNGCEPSGVCKTASCSLRVVSPLPLFSKSEARNGSGVNWSDARKEVAREHIARNQQKLTDARITSQQQKLNVERV
jgi:transcriptional regulator with XRE-family HTH domain